MLNLTITHDLNDFTQIFTRKTVKQQHLFTHTVTPDTNQHVHPLVIISLLAANRSLDLTFLALADRAQKSIITRFSWSLSEIL